MNSPPEWLPDLIDPLSNWEEYLQVMHRQYRAEYKNPKRPLKYMGKPVVARVQPKSYGFEDSFWHIIGGADNIPDYERCKRLLWAGAIIRNCDDKNEIRIWRENNYRGDKRQSVILWLYQHDYVVVLEERERYFLLVTAYVVYRSKRADLQRHYDDSKTDAAN